MAAETETLKFKIADDEYVIPALDDMDMDEWQIIYDYSGLVLDDFAPCADRADEDVEAAAEEDRIAKETGETKEEKAARLANRERVRAADDGPEEQARQRRVETPAFTTALLHIGYRRAHPDAKPDAIKRLVGSTKRLDVLKAMADAAPSGGDGDVPPVLTPEPAPQLPPGSGVSSGDGSNGSQESSDRPAVRLATTGTDG